MSNPFIDLRPITPKQEEEQYLLAKRKAIIDAIVTQRSRGKYSTRDADWGMLAETYGGHGTIGESMLGFHENRVKSVFAAADKHAVPRSVALAISMTENERGFPFAIGPFGEVGVMQIDPTRHLESGRRLFGQNFDLTNNDKNAELGVLLLKDLKKRHGTWARAIQAYNGSLGLPQGLKYLNTVRSKKSEMLNIKDIDDLDKALKEPE